MWASVSLTAPCWRASLDPSLPRVASSCATLSEFCVAILCSFGSVRLDMFSEVPIFLYVCARVSRARVVIIVGVSLVVKCCSSTFMSGVCYGEASEDAARCES